MRILQVVGRLGRGGDSAAILSAMGHLQKQGVVFDFLTHPGFVERTAEQVKAAGSRVWVLPGDVRRMGSLRYFCRVYRLLREYPFQGVHFHTSLQSGVGLMAARAARVPVRVCHAHAAEIQRRANPLLRAAAVPVLRWMLVQGSTCLTACGTEAGNFLFGGREFRLLSNGVPLASYLPCPERIREGEAIRERLHISPEAAVIGQVGRLDRMKNAKHTLEAAAFLAQKRETALILVGDGEEREVLERQAAKMESQIPALKVFFTGRLTREEVSGFYHAFDCMMLPSHPGEGVPLSLLEGQAAGCPVLASRFIPRDTDAGVGLVRFLPLGSAELWAAEAEAALEKDRPDAARIGEAFRRRGFLEEEAAQRWMEIYTHGLDKKALEP